MLNLSDTAKIAIIITVFSTLMMMIVCIWYKLSKLREVMDDHARISTSNNWISIGLPWRRESINSECSICNAEKRNHPSHAEACSKPLPKATSTRNTTNEGGGMFSGKLHEIPGENNVEQEESAFTGRLTFTVEYKAHNDSLVLKRIFVEDLFPWQYSSTTKTLVMVELQLEDLYEKQRSEVQIGVHRLSYEHEFEFNIRETDLARAQFSLTVWQTDNEECADILIGQCNVVMDAENITSAPGQSREVSKKLFKKSTKKVETEVLLSLSYLPTAERLSVVVMKAKNIEIKSEDGIIKNHTTVPNPYVKVCLIYAGRKIRKKKTSVRRHDKNPVYNESMIFDVPANFLHKIGFLITIEHKNFDTDHTTVLGRVVMGSPVHNNALRHWNQMLAFPRRPIAAWHKVFYLG